MAMNRILKIMLLGIAFIGPVSAEDETAEQITPEEIKVRRVEEVTMHNAVLIKIRAEHKKAPVADLSQLLKESDAKESDDTHRDYDTEVKKIFETLY